MPENRHTDSRTKPGERIAKAIARAGLASRREAEAWIAAGRVAVNGKTIASPAVNIGPRDTITVDGKPLPRRERTRLFLFHKPRGLVTTTYDPEGRATIFSVLPKHLPRLIAVGRLDYNTEGLLLLTNDGGLARVLEHPRTGWLRRYRVRAHGSITQPELDRLRDGISIASIHYGAIEATLERVQGGNVWLAFAIREGKNREVRNVLAHLGLTVNRLIRVSFGPFQLGDLAEGDVAEVPTPALRQQLGDKVIASANADFDAPLHASPAASEAHGDARHRPRPWRGRTREIPIAASTLDPETPRKTKAGLLTDRKGRRVLVERTRSEPPPEPQKPQRRERRPPRDRRRGPRPSRPTPRDKP